ATLYGGHRYDDRLSDLSAAAIQANIAEERRFLGRLQAIPSSSLSAEDRLNQQLLERNLKSDIRSFDLKLYEMPLDQFGGMHLLYAQLASIQPFRTVQDYDNYLSRLHQLPRALDQLTDLARLGMKDHLMPPRYLLEKVAGQAAAIGVKGEKS